MRVLGTSLGSLSQRCRLDFVVLSLDSRPDVLDTGDESVFAGVAATAATQEAVGRPQR